MKRNLYAPLIFVMLFGVFEANALSCKGQLNISIDSRGNAEIRPADLLAGSRCLTCIYRIQPRNVFHCEDVGQTFRVILTELNLFTGITQSCISMVSVENKLLIDPCVAPAIICRANVILSLGSDGHADLTPSMVGVDLDPSITYSVEPSSFECYDVGIHRGILRGTSASGLENSCIFNVIVVDNRRNPPPCVYIIDAGVDFYPADRIDLPFPTGSYIDFRISGRAISSKNTNIKFRYLLSPTPVISQNSFPLAMQNIVFKAGRNNFETKGRLTIPNINPGKYFLIGSFVDASGKVQIPFNPIVKEILVIGQGNGQVIGNMVNDKMTLYPNPASTWINLTTEDDQLTQGIIYNRRGEIEKKVSLNLDNGATISIEDLKPGLYLMEVLNIKGISVKKTFIKE